MPDDRSAPSLTAGGALFSKLKALGITHVFANSGTDFPPIIEGLAQARAQGLDLPEPVTVPHEHAAVSMAHGFYQISGQAQAVMLHTNVGLANGTIGAINAWCDQIPMLLMSGRTPTTEHSRFGARTVPIGWGQEMFDQHALIRETTKFDYELRFPEQLPDLLDRAYAIANSTPKGPAYLGLPREVLCEPVSADTIDTPARLAPVRTAPDPGALDRAASLLARAQTPLIIAQRGAGTQAGFTALAELANTWALPISHYWANQIAIPMSHPMQIGVNPDDLLAQADVVLILDALAPWWPDHVTLRTDAEVIQAGPDPLFSRTPVRNFPADVTLAGDTAAIIHALSSSLSDHARDTAALANRRSRIAALSDHARAKAIALAEAGATTPMTKDWVSLCLGRAIAAQDRPASVFHELGAPLAALNPDQHLGYFQEPHSGGLGWGLPAALGAQMADPGRLIFATMGDGSYMFANPTACHMVAEGHDLPVITLVLNNREWGAVRHSVQGLYPGGDAAHTNQVPLTDLEPGPDFTLTAEASRAYTQRVTDGRDLPAALDRAIHVATQDRRQVLLDIAITRTGGP